MGWEVQVQAQMVLRGIQTDRDRGMTGMTEGGIEDNGMTQVATMSVEEQGEVVLQSLLRGRVTVPEFA